jgi:hypothetical protein
MSLINSQNGSKRAPEKVTRLLDRSEPNMISPKLNQGKKFLFRSILNQFEPGSFHMTVSAVRLCARFGGYLTQNWLKFG